MTSILQISGIIGALILLLAFALLEWEKISSNSIKYHLMNLVGSSLIIASLFAEFNIAMLFMEIFWSSIAIYGLYRIVKS